MGRTTTTTYRIEMTDNTTTTRMSWRGKATQKNLLAYVLKYAKSLEHNGCNAHVSEALGFVPYPVKAQVVHQDTGNVQVTWKAPLFMVW